MKVLLWHVHGTWTTASSRAATTTSSPCCPGARSMAWASPAVYVEHNAPQGRIAGMRHPMAARGDVVLVHVTHFNELFWDADGTRTRVIEHGIVDPGLRYGGELPRAVAVINEARRRGRMTGTDLLGRFQPLDLFGIGADDLPQPRLHDELARRRAYVHPIRWTSLGLSLLEAMHLGMPVVALGTTEVREAVPPMLVPSGMRTRFFGDRPQEFKPAPDQRLNDPADVAAAVPFALRRPPGVELRELVITPAAEPSWP
jgi:glycosyltransferase involved in cell wall biosynthesis